MSFLFWYLSSAEPPSAETAEEENPAIAAFNSWGGEGSPPPPGFAHAPPAAGMAAESAWPEIVLCALWGRGAADDGDAAAAALRALATSELWLLPFDQKVAILTALVSEATASEAAGRFILRCLRRLASPVRRWTWPF